MNFFEAGSKLYNSNKQEIGTVSSFQTLQQLTPNGAAHDPAINNYSIMANRLRLRSCGLTYTRNGSAVQYGAGFLEITSGDPSQKLILGDKIYYQTDGDTEIGTVALTPMSNALDQTLPMPTHLQAHHTQVLLLIARAATFGTDGVLTLDDAPSRFLVVGDELAYFSGGIGVGTGKFISEIDNEANTIKVDISGGAPTILQRLL